MLPRGEGVPQIPVAPMEVTQWPMCETCVAADRAREFTRLRRLVAALQADEVDVTSMAGDGNKVL